MPDSAIILCILYSTFRKYLIHVHSYLIPRKIIYIVQTKHDSPTLLQPGPVPKRSSLKELRVILTFGLRGCHSTEGVRTIQGKGAFCSAVLRLTARMPALRSRLRFTRPRMRLRMSAPGFAFYPLETTRNGTYLTKKF